MASKFSLDPAPTFSASVEIPVHGRDPVAVQFEFKHRTRDAMGEFFDSVAARPAEESILEIVAGWELDDPLNLESVAKLLQNYQGAGTAIVKVYAEQLRQNRLGN